MKKGALSPASEFALSSLSRSGDALLEAAGRVFHLGEADPEEALHELRVAIRRARAGVRTFEPVLEPVWLAATKNQLRDLARVVGQARDLDVIYLRLEQLVEALPEHDRRAADALLAELRLDQRAARRRALESLGDRDRAAMIEGLALISASAPLAADANQVAIEDLIAVTRRQWRRLRKSFRAAEAAPSDDALHRIRVRAKTLRYSLDALGPVLHRSARDHVKALIALQDHLGEMQDAVVIEQWLRVAHETGRGDAFVVGELVGLERARKERLRATWRDQWKHAARPKLRRWTA